MGKRASTAVARPVATPSKKCKDEHLAGLTPDAKNTLNELPWVDLVMSSFDELIVSKGSMSAWLHSEFPTPEDRLKMAMALEEAFPMIPDVQYINGYSLGLHRLRIWHVNYDVAAGNKGLVQLDQLRNLVLLIICNGMKTDPLVPGTEVPVICTPNPTFWATPPSFPEVAAGLLGVGAVAFVKCWTRCIAALGLAWLLVKLDLVETTRTTHPLLHDSLRCLWGNLAAYSSEQAMIDANRGACPLGTVVLACLGGGALVMLALLLMAMVAAVPRHVMSVHVGPPCRRYNLELGVHARQAERLQPLAPAS